MDSVTGHSFHPANVLDKYAQFQLLKSHLPLDKHSFLSRFLLRHVHFRDAENVGNKPASNGIIIEQLSLSELRVHLGFLQIYHVYELRIAIDKTYIPFMSPHNVQEIHSSIVAGPCVRVLEISDENEPYWDLTVHLKARRERLLKEPLKMQFGEQKIEIVLYARVLGHGKGTPSLKSGIQSIAVEPDEESEVSDWRGFD